MLSTNDSAAENSARKQEQMRNHLLFYTDFSALSKSKRGLEKELEMWAGFCFLASDKINKIK